MTATAVDRIVVRHPTFDLADLPLDWVAGRRLATHFGNAGHVFIPVGEQFFIDTVKAYRDRIHDEEQRRQINAFLGQEAVHKRAHEQVWDLLRERGLPVDRYVAFIGAVRSIERSLPGPFRLSVTAALEHYTAVFGHSFLTEDLQRAVPPEMARLLAWHGLEELEHRAVAFDVLRAVDGSYACRAAGFAFATALLVVVPLAGVVLFAVADRAPRTDQPDHRRVSDLRSMTARFAGRMGRQLLQYLRPGFHPADIGLPAEADAWRRSFEAS